MNTEEDHVQISKLEKTLMVGIVACMLFATWELGHLMVHRWLKTWVGQNDFVNARIIYYGIAFLMAIIAVITTSSFSMRFGRFGNTINRAFLWYGTLLLISTIAIFVFDCLPEVIAGFLGAAIFIVAIFILQKKYFTKERVVRIRFAKGRCPKCAADLQSQSLFCPACGSEIGKQCPHCKGYTQLLDRYCSHCGKPLDKSANPSLSNDL